MQAELFAATRNEILDQGAVLLRGFAKHDETALLSAVTAIAATATFRHMVTPGGKAMSAAMTSCGLGWVTDRRGYRYEPNDPATGQPWPAIPASFLTLASRAAQQAGYPAFLPDACLINRYQPGAKMALHQDKDEHNFAAPIVSISLGLPAIFLWGGKTRADKPQRINLESGDIVIWGGPSRLNFHGIATVKKSSAVRQRINLTFRKAR